MKVSTRVALALGFFVGLIAQTWAATAEFDQRRGGGASAASINAALAGQALSVGSLAVTTGNVTLSTAGSLVLGNNANSRISGGSSGYIRVDDGVGVEARYTANSTFVIDGTNQTHTMAAGSLIVSGDATSPAKAAFRITPQDAQPTGASVVGDMYVTSAGVLRICTAAGTPGTWANVGAQ